MRVCVGPPVAVGWEEWMVICFFLTFLFHSTLSPCASVMPGCYVVSR